MPEFQQRVLLRHARKRRSVQSHYHSLLRPTRIDGNSVGRPTTVAWLPGDVNFDGVTNGLDISDVAKHWLQSGAGIEGDANGDGIVNGLDITLIAQNWLRTNSIYGGGSGTAVGVPEPSTIGLAAIGLCGLAAGVRRRKRLRM